MNVFELVDEHFKMQQGGTWEKQQAKVKAEKDAKLKLLLQDKDFLNNLKEQSKSNKNKEVNLKSSDATKVVTKNRPELTSKVARNKTDQEIADERQYIREQSNKNPLNTFSGIVQSSNWTRENLSDSAKGLESQYRVSDKPNFFDDWVNPANMVGSMASNLGQAPLQAEQSDSVLPYLTSIGTPLAVGAFAGIGANSTGQFVNNLANPLVGTGDLIDNLGNKYLPNAYKLNPFAFKPNPEAYYHRTPVFENNINNGNLTSWTQSPEGKVATNNFENSFGKGINLKKAPNSQITFSKGVPLDFGRYNTNTIVGKSAGQGYEGPFLWEVENVPFKGSMNGVAKSQSAPTKIGSYAVPSEIIPLNKAKLYKEDWLKGYKQIDVPKPAFKSEIDWARWNKEIPENKSLMQEYNAIEQQAKADGTWMKNPDGSPFRGTPEQFVQQNSENFKKAFPKGFEETYRGTTGESPNLKPNRAMFTGEQKVARAYSGRDNVDNILKSEEIVNEGGVHHFVYPKSENSLVHNTAGSHWTDVNLNSSETNIKNIDLAIQRLTEDIDRKQKMMREAFQNSDGSWSFPNSDLKLSNQLYKEGTSESERMLTKLKSQKNLIQNGEYTSNPTLLNKMKSDFGTDKVVTDDIAEYIEKNNIDNVTLRNIEDGIYGDISIINHKPGNYLKSFWGNNGMFDMNNPNIYKSIIPIAGATYLATQGQQDTNKLQQGGVYTDNEKKFIEELVRLKLI